jgi:hypothetical protein
MIIEIYILFWVIALFTMLMSFVFRVKKYTTMLLPFISMSFFFFLGITSYNITIPFCSYSSEWSCYSYSSSEPFVGYLAYGLGMIMLMYAIYNSITTVGESLEKA